MSVTPASTASRTFSGATVLVTAINLMDPGERPLRMAAVWILPRIRRQFSRTSVILLMAARYRAGIRSAHLIDGCALSRWHSLRSSRFLRARTFRRAAVAGDDGLFFDCRRLRRLRLFG